MKQQIARFSPHQNAKVAAILSALLSLVFVIPMFVVFKLNTPPADPHGNPTGFPLFMLLFPVIYLILGYIFTVIGCAIYNFLFRYIGGFEYESSDRQA